MKIDGLKIGDYEIEVVISNFLQRGIFINVREETLFILILGGGKKEIET